MEIRPIFSAMLRNKTAPLLVALLSLDPPAVGLAAAALMASRSPFTVVPRSRSAFASRWCPASGCAHA